jgi:perosamine synthetase
MILASSFIPVNEPLLDGNEKTYLAECIETGWISSEGPFVQRLEEGLATRLGRRYGVAVCNGSVALEAAVAALGLGPGDEVILPSFTIISCASAIVRAGATPVVVDSEPDTWNMDVTQIERAITPRTKAIMVVHIYGLPVNMGLVVDLSRRRGLKIVEDAAEALGQSWGGRPCGSFGDVSALSFYPNKHVTTGEGGVVLTDDPVLAERLRSLRNLCFQKRRFVHDELGWNFRMSNLQAAVGVAQLERLDEFVERKRRMGRLYNECLSGTAGITLPLPATADAENVYWVYGVVLQDEVPFDAMEAMKRLAALDVGTRPFFWPMHEQPVFHKMGLLRDVSCPVASRLARRGFYLPSGLALTDDQIRRSAAACRAMLAQS